MRFTKKRKRGGFKYTRKRRKLKRRATVGAVRRLISRAEESKWIAGNSGPTNSVLFGYANTFCAAAGTNIALGSDRKTRTGNQVTLQSLQIDCKSFLQAPTAGFVTTAVIRMIIFADKSNNGTNFTAYTPTQACNFLFADPSTGNAYTSALSPVYFPSKFKLLMDKRWVLRTTGGATDEPSMVMWKKYLKVRGMKVQWNDNGGATPVDIQKNAIYCFITTDVATSALGTQPDIAFSYTLRYKDA